MLLEGFERDYLLGVAAMDATHREFVALLNRLDDAPKDTFIPLFAELLAHTEAHFAAEGSWMSECGFPAIREHRGEHERVLGELHRFNARVAAGQVAMGRAYVRERLPAWFDLHARTMDSALAAHLVAYQGAKR